MSIWRPTWLNRTVVAWASYDAASSAYFGIVPPLLFPVFIVEIISHGKGPVFALGAAVSTALVVAGMLAPLVGRAADNANERSLLLALFTGVYCLATAGLGLVGPDQVLLAASLFAVAQTAYLLAMLLYESYLPHLARPEFSGRISTFGWSVGFLGGIVSLLAVLFLTRADIDVSSRIFFQLAFALVVAIVIVGAVPAILAIRRDVEPTLKAYAGGQRPSVWETLRNWRDHRELFKLIAAFYLVNDGMVTITIFAAAYFRTNFGTSIIELLQLLLVYHIIAVPATLASGMLADRWSQRKTIALSTSIWSLAVLLMAFSVAPWVPILVAILLGLVLGSTQAMFRALLAQMVPRQRAAEFFGFNTFAGRISAALGPLAYGLTELATGSQRVALLSVLVFIVAGVAVLSTVRLPDRV